MAQIIAVINQKGGVGKTTTAINVATSLQKLGKSVLLADLDPQGNASSGIGAINSGNNPTTYDILIHNTPLEEVTQKIERLELDLLPANPSLAAAEVELVEQDGRELKLKNAFVNSSKYDVIIIDCPPALGLLTINALTAANWVLIPVQAEYYALEGLSQLLSVIQRIRQGLNPGLELLGVVATMHDSRTSLSDQVYQELQKHFGDKLFETIIPRNVRLAEAPSYGKTIFEHDKWSKGARKYKLLTKEIVKRLGV